MLVQKIHEILEMNLTSEAEEKLLTERAKKMDQIIDEKSNYYIAHFPDRRDGNNFKLIHAWDYIDLIQELSIKEGVDLRETVRGLQLLAYYGSYTQRLNLYPIDDGDAGTLRDMIDNADFPESIVIESQIAQFCY